MSGYEHALPDATTVPWPIQIGEELIDVGRVAYLAARTFALERFCHNSPGFVDHRARFRHDYPGFVTTAQVSGFEDLL